MYSWNEDSIPWRPKKDKKKQFVQTCCLWHNIIIIKPTNEDFSTFLGKKNEFGKEKPFSSSTGNSIQVIFNVGYWATTEHSMFSKPIKY